MSNNDNEFDQKLEEKQNFKTTVDEAVPVKCTNITTNVQKDYDDVYDSTENSIEKGFKIQDVVNWEKEVKEMMESVREIHKKLQDDATLGEVFTFPIIDYKKDKALTDEELQSYIQDIEKMDLILKAKTAEEKQAKLDRIQEEDETRKILDDLSEFSVSNAIKMNNEKFLKLLNCMETTEDGKEETHKEIDEEFEIKKKKKNIQQPTSFIGKNIELAKCGQGVLSLTKYEELRIQTLLEETEKTNSSGVEASNPISDASKNEIKSPLNEKYALDEESELILSEIDKKLEAFEKFKNVEKSLSKLSVLKTDDKLSINNGDENEGKPIGIKSRRRNNKIRLLEIDKLLTSFNTVSNEEIDPLPLEDLEFLLQEAKNSLDISNSVEDSSKFPATENIAELVVKAKTLMPNFKFRYQE